MVLVLEYVLGRVTAREFRSYRERPCLVVVSYRDRMGFRTARLILGRPDMSLLPQLETAIQEAKPWELLRIAATTCPRVDRAFIEFHMVTIGLLGVESEEYTGYVHVNSPNPVMEAVNPKSNTNK